MGSAAGDRAAPAVAKARPGVDEQRRIITEAAVRLFVEQGSSAAGVSAICEAAEVSRPTFYRCFEDKDALVEHIYAGAVDDHVRLNLASLLSDDRNENSMRVRLDVMVDGIFEHAGVAAFLFVESSDERSRAHRIVTDAFERAAEQVEAWYEDRGLEPPMRTTLLATMVACQWIVHDAIRHGLTPERRAEARAAMWDLVRRVFTI